MPSDSWSMNGTFSRTIQRGLRRLASRKISPTSELRSPSNPFANPA
jgi:hypothetical protein